MPSDSGSFTTHNTPPGDDTDYWLRPDTPPALPKTGDTASDTTGDTDTSQTGGAGAAEPDARARDQQADHQRRGPTEPEQRETADGTPATQPIQPTRARSGPSVHTTGSPARPAPGRPWIHGDSAEDPRAQAPTPADPPHGLPAQAAAPEPSPSPPAPSTVPPQLTAAALTTGELLAPTRPAPAAGWRRTVHRLTGGMIHPHESAAERRRHDLVARARTPVAAGHHRIAVLSLTGGVGKTTIATTLGSTLASLRGDRVIAMDANPDRGTLSDKIRLQTTATVRDLLEEQDQVRRYADIRAYTSQTWSRLEVLAGERNPHLAEAFGEKDFRTTAKILERFYSVCLVDCSTGLLQPAMTGVLDLADQIIVASSPSVDGARSANAALDWLHTHGHGVLATNAIVVISTAAIWRSHVVDLDLLERHFAGRCWAAIRVPHDAHLEEGAEIHLDQLHPATWHAYLHLAATAAAAFGTPHRPHRSQEAHGQPPLQPEGTTSGDPAPAQAPPGAV